MMVKEKKQDEIHEHMCTVDGFKAVQDTNAMKLSRFHPFSSSIL